MTTQQLLDFINSELEEAKLLNEAARKTSATATFISTEARIFTLDKIKKFIEKDQTFPQ